MDESVVNLRGHSRNLFGTRMGCPPPSSAYAAAGRASQDQLTKELTSALTQRVSSARFTYSGKLASLKKDVNAAWNKVLSADDYLHYVVKGYSYNATGN